MTFSGRHDHPLVNQGGFSTLELLGPFTRDEHLLDGRKWSGQLTAAVVTAAVGCLTALPSCFAQTEPEPSVNDYLPPSEPEPSRDAWRQRIDEARRRAKEVSRERREHPALYAPVPEDPEIVATERVLNDESLQRGDIITTKKGMFIYQGRSDQPRREQDFVPIAPKLER